MATEDKKILHSHHDKNFMEVVDHGDFRSLNFNNEVVQSRIRLNNPGNLVLRYTQYMMAASLLAVPQPQRILLIGVGAGALVHFCNTHLSRSHMDAVDYSEHILGIARGYFSLPETERIHVHCNDGMKYLSSLRSDKLYDLILVDAFNDKGMAKNIYSNDFLKLARKHISEEGVICCNLWSGDEKLFNRVKKAIQKNSVGNVFIPVRKRENFVALLFQTATPWKKLCLSSKNLLELSERYAIDFKAVSASMKKHNLKLAEKVQLWLH